MLRKSREVTLTYPYLFRGLRGRVCLRRLALKLLAPLRWGSNPMRGSCQLLMEGCWFTPRDNLFTPRNNVFLQLWKLTAICNITKHG